MDENKKRLEALKEQYDQIVNQINKILKKDDSKTLVEYQQKIEPLLTQKAEIVRNLDQMYKIVRTDFDNQRKQLKIREAEIKKQAKLQKRRKR